MGDQGGAWLERNWDSVKEKGGSGEELEGDALYAVGDDAAHCAMGGDDGGQEA